MNKLLNRGYLVEISTAGSDADLPSDITLDGLTRDQVGFIKVLADKFGAKRDSNDKFGNRLMSSINAVEWMQSSFDSIPFCSDLVDDRYFDINVEADCEEILSILVGSWDIYYRYVTGVEVMYLRDTVRFSKVDDDLNIVDGTTDA